MSEWQPASSAKPDGTICNIRCRDVLGVYDVLGSFFLHDDGEWYGIDPPSIVGATVAQWKEAE